MKTQHNEVTSGPKGSKTLNAVQGGIYCDKRVGDLYMLVRTSPDMYAFIELRTGNRFENPSTSPNSSRSAVANLSIFKGQVTIN
jgi:hypothetical protein